MDLAHASAADLFLQLEPGRRMSYGRIGARFPVPKDARSGIAQQTGDIVGRAAGRPLV